MEQYQAQRSVSESGTPSKGSRDGSPPVGPPSRAEAKAGVWGLSPPEDKDFCN